MDPSEPPPWGAYLLAVAGLLVCSMFFSAAESAFLSSSKLRIRYLKEKNNRAASRVDRLLDRRNFFINLILIGNNVVNIAMSSLITSVSLRLFGDAGIGVATACATVIILVFGEILPKSIAIQRPEPIALRLSLPLSILAAIMAPVVFVFTALTQFITFALTTPAARARAKSAKAVTEDDIKTLIEVGEEEGLIESHEREMMTNVLKYADLAARDVMTTRTAIVGVSEGATRGEIIALSKNSAFSRFPVFGDDIDDIRGILYVKDFLFAPEGESEDYPAKKYLRPALFVLENRKVASVQASMRKGLHGIAVVLDEYGGTAGILTVSDLAAEIFGAVDDEYDDTRETKARSGWDALPAEFDGTERLDAINELLGAQLASEFYDTVGGLAMERAGEIPVAGYRFLEGELEFTVLEMEGNRVARVRASRRKGGDK